MPVQYALAYWFFSTGIASFITWVSWRYEPLRLCCVVMLITNLFVTFAQLTISSYPMAAPLAWFCLYGLAAYVYSIIDARYDEPIARLGFHLNIIAAFICAVLWVGVEMFNPPLRIGFFTTLALNVVSVIFLLGVFGRNLQLRR